MFTVPWMGLGTDTNNRLNESPSGSESLASTLTVTGVFSKVVAVSGLATGGLFTVTVTRKLHEFELPDVSKAVQTTVVGPGGKVLPASGEQPKVAIPHTSEAPAMKLTATPAALEAVAAMLLL